jgi:predicted MFS family arabinose efflux permease
MIFLIVFDHPRTNLLGLMSSLYSLGAIVVLPFVPIVTDQLGRRMAIIVGSLIMIVGAVIQAAAQDCERLSLRKCCV